LPLVNWAGTVHHGLPRDLLPFNPTPDGAYLAFLGRISPEKRPDRAIEIAKVTGSKLKIAAKIDRVDEDYWNDVIKPMIAAAPNVEFVGEINELQKADFLGNAAALLFPIDWPEPFGLVMIEAMACGTPVIAYRRGSAPEVIDDGLTGFLVDDISEAAAAVRRLGELDRARTRAVFERRFAIERVAFEYEQIYRSLPGVQAARRGARRRDDLGLRLIPTAGRVEQPIMLKPGGRGRVEMPELVQSAPKD
jgi:glycosyltransferase involved in cell wall biosynthesis